MTAERHLTTARFLYSDPPGLRQFVTVGGLRFAVPQALLPRGKNFVVDASEGSFSFLGEIPISAYELRPYCTFERYAGSRIDRVEL